MKPFVGLPVLFTGKHFLSTASKSAAIVVAVQSDTLVNLTVFNEHGNTYGVVGVRVVYTPDDIVGGENYCEFHPEMMASDEVEMSSGPIEVRVEQIHDPED
jgi:hypothetical protein